MNRKKKRYIVVIMPAMFTVIIIGGLLSFVLIAGAAKGRVATADAAPVAPYKVADADNAVPVPGVVEGSPGQEGASEGSPGQEGTPDGAATVASPDSPNAAGGSRGEEGGVLPPEMKPQPCDFAQWVGKPVDTNALDALKRPYRVLKPNESATMDYSPARIDVEVDKAGTVRKVTCG